MDAVIFRQPGLEDIFIFALRIGRLVLRATCSFDDRCCTVLYLTCAISCYSFSRVISCV